MTTRGFVIEAFRPKREKGGPWLVMSDEYMNWLLYTAHPAYDETCSPAIDARRCAKTVGLLAPYTEHYGIVDVVAAEDGIALDVMVRLPSPADSPAYYSRVRNTVRSYLERKLNEMGEPSVVPRSVRKVS